MGKTRKAYAIFVGQPEGKRPHRTPSIHGKIILNCVLKKHSGRVKSKVFPVLN
jgi:hypothetical protein